MKSSKDYLIESTQQYDSAKTSLAQIAATFKLVSWVENTVNLDYGGTAYFLIYEGNRTGVGAPTIKGWQNNLSTPAYLMDVKQIFGNVQRKGNLLIAKK